MSLNLDAEIARDYKKQAFLRDQGFCKYCGLDFMQSLSHFWSYTVDHVEARSVGGKNVATNVVLCCKACNEALSRSGHLRTFEERKSYIQSQEEGRLPIYKAWRERLRRGA
ncbi:HNH endonuclease signature motif containing protein [Stenotrophomonas sp. Marseille-Q4652]|uniref:HNH endonuclease n=1 Tax=Stenotrophomonas sp. Marseille-Q4652 TaxID=2866595 RepID=UPI001CE41144|nr:HNH endonuclease signature motif containing protein [Stenotrophomonas sp. Marseille-Q4652]